MPSTPSLSMKKFLPHLIAIATFLLVSIVYNFTAIQGKVLEQHDNIHWKGMSKSAYNYKEENGKFPLWNDHLFSGMPNYQVSMEGESFMIDMHSIFTLGLPKPISFFFLACLCFYLLSQVLGVHYVVGIFTALAFAYSTYDPVIIAAGHESKMIVMSYMPAVLAGLILIFQKKYWIGLAVTAVAASWHVGFNHFQVTYYFSFVVGLVFLGYLIQWIRAKEWKHLVITSVLCLLAGFIAFANTALVLLTTKEYSSYTMRGGKSIDIQGDQIKEVNTDGLDKSYAFSYSLSKQEVITLFMPDAFGASSQKTVENNKAFISSLTDKNIPEDAAVQLSASLPAYWGGIKEGTSGPVYVGAILFFLAMLSLVLVSSPLKWWYFSAATLGVFISWGSYFPELNHMFFDHLPLFKRFRAHSMAMIIPQLIVPILAALTLQSIFVQSEGKELLKKNIKGISYTLGTIFGVSLLIYLLNDYSGGIDEQIIQAYTNPQNGDKSNGLLVVNALIEARKSMLFSSIIKAFFFAAALLGVFYLFYKNLIRNTAAILLLLVIGIADLLVVGKDYLNSKNYTDKEQYEGNNFELTAADQSILADKDPHFRVYNLAPDRFNEAITSYYHRSAGGYHAAKLGLYQDFIEGQLAKSPMNPEVLNMLDVKYFLIPGQDGKRAASFQQNPAAYGPLWLVKGIKLADGPAEEMKALNDLNARDTAVVNKIDAAKLQPFTSTNALDSAATFKLSYYSPDTIRYEIKTQTAQFAVFSEIYYPAGWNAFVNGVPVDIIKTNYLLRGLVIPAGNNKVEFRFEPKSFETGQKLIYVGNILLWLSIAFATVMGWRKRKLV